MIIGNGIISVNYEEDENAYFLEKAYQEALVDRITNQDFKYTDDTLDKF